MLYLTLGERDERDKRAGQAPAPRRILRLRDDGTVPPDNPFVGRGRSGRRSTRTATATCRAWRSIRGRATLWETEHGPQGGDELNMIEPGKNYGWPLVTLGREVHRRGDPTARRRTGSRTRSSAWLPSIGISGLAFYTGDKFPAWKGSVFVGGLSGQQRPRVVLQRSWAGRTRALLDALRLRVRDVRQGPDGLSTSRSTASRPACFASSQDRQSRRRPVANSVVSFGHFVVSFTN